MKYINPRGARNEMPGVQTPVGTVDPHISDQPPAGGQTAFGTPAPGSKSPVLSGAQAVGTGSGGKPGQAPGGVIAQETANRGSDLGYGTGFIAKKGGAGSKVAPQKGAATSEPNAEGTSSPDAKTGPGGLGLPAIGAPLT